MFMFRGGSNTDPIFYSSVDAIEESMSLKWVCWKWHTHVTGRKQELNEKFVIYTQCVFVCACVGVCVALSWAVGAHWAIIEVMTHYYDLARRGHRAN